MRYFIVLIMLFSLNCYADTIIETARKVRKLDEGGNPIKVDGKFVYIPQKITVLDGSIVKGPNSKWHGTIENLDSVVFQNWNFNREIPHTQVFVNCTNLTFIDCSLVNVELQDDFIHQGSLTIHVTECENLGVKYRKVECGDNKIREYDVSEYEIDIVDQEFPELEDNVKEKIRKKYKDDGMETVEKYKKNILVKVEETSDDKKIKGIKISPNDIMFDSLRKSN